MDIVSSIEDISRLIFNKDLCIFVGAGISIAPPTLLPSFIDLQNEVIFALCRDLAGPLRESYEGIYNQIRRRDYKEEIIRRFINIAPEYIFEICKRNITLENDKHIQYDLWPLNTFSKRMPNRNHFILADWLINGNVPVIFTTNFDFMIEDAASSLLKRDVMASSLRKIWRNNQFDGIADVSHLLVKLHGSIDDPSSIAISLDEIGKRCASQKYGLLRHCLEKYNILFCGFRGADLDIFSVMATTKCKRIFWNTRSEENIINKIRILLEKKNGSIIEGNLDEMLVDISKKLGTYKSFFEDIRKTSGKKDLINFEKWAKEIETVWVHTQFLTKQMFEG